MMKKIFALAAVVLALSACGGGNKNKPDNPKPEQADITGVWELTSVTTKASVGSVTVSVYLDFVSGGTFNLYQKIGEGRYTQFTGKYAFTDGKLSGSYDGGSSWGPYTAEVNGSTLALTTAGGGEVDTYKKISSVPASVTSNLY